LMAHRQQTEPLLLGSSMHLDSERGKALLESTWKVMGSMNNGCPAGFVFLLSYKKMIWTPEMWNI
jgi:hypothetical protein